MYVTAVHYSVKAMPAVQSLTRIGQDKWCTTGYRLEDDQDMPWWLVNFNAGSARVCVCVECGWTLQVSISGGDESRWVVGGCMCAAGAGPLVLPGRFPSRLLPVIVAQHGSSTPTLPPIPGAPVVSATTVKSQLTHSPPPHLTSLLVFTGLPAGSTISRYSDTNSNHNRCGFFATI